jgi:enterochelin esterase-like enzyme
LKHLLVESRSFLDSQRMFAVFLVGIALILLFTGCALPSQRPLPTLAARAAAPTIQPTSAPTVAGLEMPVTFTAAAPASQAAGLITRTATPVPPATPRPTATPLPLVVSRVSSPLQLVNAPYVESPPPNTPCNGQGTVFNSRFPSDVAGPSRAYHVYLPPCYGRDGRVYPVLYLIHGSIQSDSHWLELGLAEAADAGINSGRWPPFIAIMPFSGQLGNLTSGGPKSIEGITLNYLLPYVDSAYCSWPEADGRAIGGISRGGYWALEIAINNPQYFSAVAGHSSHLRLQTDPEKYNPLVTYAKANLSRLRIWLDRGEKDFLRPGQEQFHESLSAAGIPHEYQVNPGGHNESYWAAHLVEYLDWHTAAWPKDRTLYPSCN